MNNDIPQIDPNDLPVDRLLRIVMDAIRAKNPSLSTWCDRKTLELNERNRMQIFLWLTGGLDEDNMKIFADAVGLTVRELRITRKVAIEIF